MKKSTILIFIMLFAFSTLLTIKTKASAIVTPETASSCLAATDADGDTLTGLADSDCAAFVETSDSCAASIDADGDTLTGLADSDCAAFATSSEDSASCLASIDKDGDTLTGLADSDCAPFLTVATTTATTTPTTTPIIGGGSGGFSGSSFGGSTSAGTPISLLTSGTPISGVITSSSTGTTTCADMFKTYMKKGKKNDVTEVKKLQSFLNKELGLKMSITGFFGNLTHDAVKAFQEKYPDTVLKPWGFNKSTGYFYKTTQRQANLLLCSSADIPMPKLK